MADPPVYTVSIQAPLEKVWPLVGDLGRQSEWSPKPYRVEWQSGEPNAVGSTFRSIGWLPQDKEHVMEGVVTANEPMKVFEVTTHDAKEEWTNRYELTPTGSGTTVTKTVIWPPLSGVKAFGRSAVFALYVNGAMRKGLAMLKERAEAGA
jgi:uncharacterized protein YndB with AHSA1/START domain